MTPNRSSKLNDMLKTQLLTIALLWATQNLYVHSQTYSYRFIDDKQVAEVPMKLINNLPVIEVTINKQKKLNFILDTGMRTTIVFSKRYVKGLDYKLGREIEFAGVGNGGLVRGRIASDVTVNIGNIEGDGLSLLILGENQGIKKSFKDLGIHGIIGYELFARFVVEIDYYNKMISFCEHGYFDFEDVYEQMPLLIHDTKPHIYAALKLNGKDKDCVRLMLDTGSSTTMLLGGNYKSEDHLAKNKTVAVGLSGKISGSIVNLQEFEIKSFKMKNIPALMVANSDFMANNRANERIGSLGGGMFLAYAIVFDYARSHFYIKRQHPSNNRIVVSL